MLRWHWGEAYAIHHPAPDVWVAVRRDDHATLRGTTPMGLRERIIADYCARPVPRNLCRDEQLREIRDLPPGICLALAPFGFSLQLPVVCPLESSE
jgi:hypothetical protein